MRIFLVEQGDYGDNASAVIAITLSREEAEIAVKTNGQPDFGPVEIREWEVDHGVYFEVEK